MAFSYIKNNDNTLTVNDPIYGTIIIPYPYSAIILSKEMQRLGDICQTGFSQYEFKGLEENDRLSHSVGAFYVMTMILKRLEIVLKHYNIEISEDDIDIALCSILLHDVGHGPFSHSLECVTNYSHEKRTTDILLGNTEVGNLLVKLFGNQKVRQIASFIAEINNQAELGKDSFTQLLNNLVSHQLDADRIDYLMRDSYYIKMPTAIDLKRVISSLSVVVNNNQEYELLINRSGLSSIENILIQRYQMYRDVYLCPISVLSDVLFKKLLERYRQNPQLHSLPVSKYFRILANDPAISNLDDFIEMTDKHFKYSFAVLMQNEIDPISAYLSNPDKLSDYLLIENDVPIERIKSYLREIFGNIELGDTLSIINVKTKSKLYKKEQRLNIQFGNRISDLTDCTNLIRPQELLQNTYTFFNPTLLRMELGLTEEEFKKYESEVKKMIEDLNKKPEEFELKYIISDDETCLLEKIIGLFMTNGFKVVSVTEKQNCDEYFDTRSLALYQKGGSLRIRKATQNGKVKYKGTYKMPLGEGEVYSSRTEIEESLSDTSFETFETKMKETINRDEAIVTGDSVIFVFKNLSDNEVTGGNKTISTGEIVTIDFSQIVRLPILNSTTSRTDVLLEKNGVQVCLSLDNTTYTNHFLDNIAASDRMIEIEAIGELNNRIMLNGIHEFITQGMSGLTINKQSKYERGINSTLDMYTQQHSEEQTSKPNLCLIIQRIDAA